MGTWGSGNFDSDGALDYVAEVVNGLVKRIEQTFADDLARLDDDGETVLVPTVHILTVLSESCRAAPPKPAQVASWKERYLAIYDKEIDDLDPAEGYKAERRQVIVDTFEKLEQRANGFWTRSK